MPIFAPRVSRESTASKSTSAQHNALKTPDKRPPFGNQALLRMIQRTLTINNYDTSATGSPSNQILDVNAIREAINGAVSQKPIRERIVSNLDNLNGQNHQANDVHGLVNDLCQGVNNVTEEIRAAVRKAVGDTIVNPKAEERDLYKKIIKTKPVLSYQKGHPGSVDTAKLAEIAYNAPDVVAKVTALHDSLQRPPRWITESSADVTSWVTNINSSKAQLRTPHGNGAGWLPTNSFQTTYNQHSQTVNTKVQQIRQSMNDATISSRKRERMREQSDEEVFHSAVMSSLSPSERQYFLWGAFAAQSGNSPYIEFGVPGESNARVVFDFTTGILYFTVHYNWHQGLNPFFRIV